jgi:hypothetical protein
MGMGLVGMLALGNSSFRGRKDDSRKRASRHLHFFDGLYKVVKKRETAKANSTSKSATSSAVTTTPGTIGSSEPSSPAIHSEDAKDKKGPSLQSHMSHQAIASRAGFDPKDVKGPLEHSERRWRMQKMEINVRTQQAGLANVQSLSGNRATAPSNGGAIPRAVNQVQIAQGLATTPSSRSSVVPTSGNIRPPHMTMTQAQIQQFMQRQNLLRAGFPGVNGNNGSPKLNPCKPSLFLSD